MTVHLGHHVGPVPADLPQYEDADLFAVLRRLSKKERTHMRIMFCETDGPEGRAECSKGHKFEFNLATGENTVFECLSASLYPMCPVCGEVYEG